MNPIPCFLALIVLAAIGCNQSGPSPNTQESTTTAAQTAPEDTLGVAAPPTSRSPAEKARSRILRNPDAFEFPSALGVPFSVSRHLQAAATVYIGLHAKLPDTIEDLEPYLAFDADLTGIRIHREFAGAFEVIAIERDVIDTPYAAVDGETIPVNLTTIESDLSHILGIHGNVARVYLMDVGPGGFLSGTPHEHGLFTQYYGKLQGQAPTPLVPTMTMERPLHLPEVARFAVLVDQVRDALEFYPLLEFSRKKLPTRDHARWATSLRDVEALFGSFNPAAWINPYTGQSMKNVRFSARMPGDYTELRHPQGVVVLFHYKDTSGGVSSAVCGQRGVYQPDPGG